MGNQWISPTSWGLDVAYDWDYQDDQVAWLAKRNGTFFLSDTNNAASELTPSKEDQQELSMKSILAALAAAICLFGSAQAFAYRGGVGIYLTPPAVVIQPYAPPVVVVQPAPPPPPPVYVPAPPPPPVVQYQYYPAWNVYLDPMSGLYWSLTGRGWVLGPLPAAIYPGSLGAGVVVSAPGRPWRYYRGRGYTHRRY